MSAANFCAKANLCSDYICNSVGNRAWTEVMEWPGQADYQSASMQNFKLEDDGTVVGAFKSSGNLTYVDVFNAGHMVPFNQPVASLDMVNRWTSGQWVH